MLQAMPRAPFRWQNRIRTLNFMHLNRSNGTIEKQS